jgi:hypothetical protein
MFDAQVQPRNGSFQLRYQRAQTLIGSLTSESVSRFFPAIIFVLTFVGFLPTLWNGFIDWQDAANLIDNANYRGLAWANIVWAFTTLQSGYYQPLTWLSFAIDYRLWNLDPFGFHLTSVLIHSANAALLYVIAVQLLSSTEPQQSELSMRAVRWAAAGAVLLFSLHPMRVEAVAWASARNVLLTTFFLLLALSGYLLAVQSRASNAATGSGCPCRLPPIFCLFCPAQTGSHCPSFCCFLIFVR